jgi:hypothetical protein
MSTPPLSRSNSHSSLEDLPGSGGREIEEKDKRNPGTLPAQSSASPKVPSTSNRPLQRTGTWSRGQISVANGQGLSSDPQLSPRMSAPKKPAPPPSSSAHSTTTPSTSHQASTPSTSASTTSSPLGNTNPGNRVLASDLSQRVLSYVNASLQTEGQLAPDRIGELLVAVESKGGGIKLAGDVINRILRAGLTIHDFEPGSGGGKKDINVIKSICEPFMFRHLDTPELEKSRKEFINQFARVAGKFEDLSKQVHPKEWPKFSPMKDLMGPIMKPVLGILCGAGNTLDTSELSDPIKKLLLSIDKHVILWFDKNSTGKPADLYQARKSALIGFLSTRSLAYVWYTKSMNENTVDSNQLKLLLKYMNSVVAAQIDAFVTDVLISQKDQTEKNRKYIEVLARGKTLISKPSVPSLALGERLAGRGVLSPRATRPSVPDTATSDKLSVDNSAEKDAKKKLMQIRVEHARFIDKIAKAAGLDQADYQCYQHVKEIVVKMSERGFRNFKKDPVKFYKKHAEEFYKNPVNHKRVKDGLPVKVYNALDALSLKLIGNPFEADAEDDIRRVLSATKASVSKETEKSSETEPSDESEVKTESSEEEKNS